VIFGTHEGIEYYSVFTVPSKLGRDRLHVHFLIR
jgi:hypothetical protein